MTTQAPGPKPLPFIGTAYSITPSRLVESATELGRKYGEIYVQQIPGKAPLYIVSSHRLVDELFDESRFKKVIHPAISHLEPFTGNGLFTAETDDPEWEKGHRILMPAFSPLALKGMYEGMADIAEQFMLKWTRAGYSESLDVTDDFTRLTLDTIALCSFSFRFNSFYSEKMHPFVDAMVGGLFESGRRAHAIDLQKKLMLISQRKMDGYTDTMLDTVDELIAERKANPHSADETDILDIMLAAEDPVTKEKLSDENVRFQLVNFLIAGHETTSGLLSFTMFLLLKNPEVLKKARACVDEVLDGRFPEYEDLAKLGYLDQIFRESLRLYPTAPGLAVTPFETTTIGGDDGYVIEPGDTLFVLIGLLHRDPDVWDDPESFIPERFDFDNAKNIPVSAWKPFGNGQRSCIGRAFSLQESTLVMALILQHLDFEFDPEIGEDPPLEIKESLTIKPDGFRLRVKPRKGKEFRGRGNDRSSGIGIDTGVMGASEISEKDLEELPAHGQRLQILIGSNAGTCRNFAYRIAQAAGQQGFNAVLRGLDDAVEAIDPKDPLIVVTSSYEGLPPDNARRFVDWIIEESPTDVFDGVPFAVFGSGNSQWANSFQRVPTQIDEALEKLGGRRLLERGVADVQGDFDAEFKRWNLELLRTLGEFYGIEMVDLDRVDQIEIETIDDGRASMLNPHDNVDFFSSVIISNEELSTRNAEEGITAKREVSFRLPDGVSYEVGDYLEVLPKNSPEQVSRFLERFGSTGEQRVRIHGDVVGLPKREPVAIVELLSGYFELGRVATQENIQMLADMCPCPPEAAQLEALRSDEQYAELIVRKGLTLIDLLEKFPSVVIDLESALALLPTMVPRRYSISSTPLEDPKIARITFSVVERAAKDSSRVYHGVTTNYLAHARPGQAISVAVLPGSEHFRPTGAQGRMILVGAGSGIAPLKAFIDHVSLTPAENQRTELPHLLFFGCHAEDIDFLYQDRFQSYQNAGLLDVRPAFSRDPESEVRYVQDRMWEDRAEVLEAISQDSRILVCGDAERMGTAVRGVLIRMFVEELNFSEEQAQQSVQEMASKKFTYVSDLFS